MFKTLVRITSKNEGNCMFKKLLTTTVFTFSLNLAADATIYGTPEVNYSIDIMGQPSAQELPLSSLSSQDGLKSLILENIKKVKITDIYGEDETTLTQGRKLLLAIAKQDFATAKELLDNTPGLGVKYKQKLEVNLLDVISATLEIPAILALFAHPDTNLFKDTLTKQAAELEGASTPADQSEKLKQLYAFFATEEANVCTRFMLDLGVKPDVGANPIMHNLAFGNAFGTLAYLLNLGYKATVRNEKSETLLHTLFENYKSPADSINPKFKGQASAELIKQMTDTKSQFFMNYLGAITALLTSKLEGEEATKSFFKEVYAFAVEKINTPLTEEAKAIRTNILKQVDYSALSPMVREALLLLVAYEPMTSLKDVAQKIIGAQDPTEFWSQGQFIDRVLPTVTYNLFRGLVAPDPEAPPTDIIEMISLLTEKGAGINELDQWSLTPLDRATTFNAHVDVINALKERGAKKASDLTVEEREAAVKRRDEAMHIAE